ncbi:MAG: glycosyltransferase family 2 protein [Chloroflexi bacterium]|nr:glycosyltransferase family 2 protein [Chloroflexota bacterium]
MAIINPFLSIIIPAYNEERRILLTLQEVVKHLSMQAYAAEVLVVDDGSADRTAALVRACAQDHPTVRLISNPHRGKGYAVKTGMLAAGGDFRFLCDADLAMTIEQVARFLPPQLVGFDVAIGSREAPGARRFNEPAYRHFMGHVFNLIVRLVAVPGLKDTQCGFKMFTRQAAVSLFSSQIMDGFAFDVEILFLARKRGFRIVEVAIDWHHSTDSRVRPAQDTFNMFRDALAVRWNDWRGRYDK